MKPTSSVTEWMSLHESSRERWTGVITSNHSRDLPPTKILAGEPLHMTFYSLSMAYLGEPGRD